MHSSIKERHAMAAPRPETLQSVISALKQDLAATYEAFQVDNFEECNILANRFMANSVLAGDKKVFLPGFLIKEVAVDFVNLRRAGSSLATAKPVGQEFMKTLVLKAEI
jgi:hypothetical protein